MRPHSDRTADALLNGCYPYSNIQIERLTSLTTGRSKMKRRNPVIGLAVLLLAIAIMAFAFLATVWVVVFFAPELAHGRPLDVPAVKIPTDPMPRTGLEVIPRAMVEIPKPVFRATSSTSAASGGWNSARVSWYGPSLYGNPTASGATLVQGMMNFAHRSMDFGTRIEFEYQGRTCVATCNDRGPFVGGRTFDLGPGTATALGFSGVGTVRYQILP